MDFDFFTQNPLDRDALNQKLPFLTHSIILQDQRDTLTVLAEAVKISFFGRIDFGRVGTPELTEDGVLEVASSIDLYGN